MSILVRRSFGGSCAPGGRETAAAMMDIHGIAIAVKVCPCGMPDVANRMGGGTVHLRLAQLLVLGGRQPHAPLERQVTRIARSNYIYV